MFKGSLINSGLNAKTIKGDGDEWETAIMYLAPHKVSLLGNVCANAEVAKCVDGCLFIAGRGGMSNVQQARINKTRRYFEDRAKFMADLVVDLTKFEAYCKRKGVKPAVRLNGTSDIQFEVAHPVYIDGERFDNVFEAFPEIQFYDYTKIYKRVYRDLPDNYRLVLSYSEANQGYADKVIEAAKDTCTNVAVVYRTKALRDSLMTDHLEGETRFMNRKVIDGDSDDLRFLDKHGVIVGLYAKGPAKKDQTGFVIG